MWLLASLLLFFCSCTDLVKDFCLIVGSACGAATVYKESVFDLSALYFRLGFQRYFFFGSAFVSRMMLKDLKQAFEWNGNHFTI